MADLMRKLSLPFIAGVLLFNSPVKANNLNFTLENDTDQTITGAWVSTRADQYWEPFSSFNDISAGASTYVSWPNGGPCWQQLRIKFDDGRYASWSEPFDLCTVGRIKIKYNANSNGYSANSYIQ
jgi:hypothetical protein